MSDRRRVLLPLFFVLVLSPALFAQRPGSGRDRVPVPINPAPRGTFDQRYQIQTEGTAYGLQEGQGIAGVEVVLAERRTDIRPVKEDVVGRAGRAVATSVTGVGGGVTFNNVRPGTYVVLIRMVVRPNIQSSDLRREPPVQIASLASDVAYSRYDLVKSFFESRSNIATRTAGADGQEWRSFPEGFVYAVRAPNLLRGDEECRRSRDEVANRETIIAQEFQVRGSVPVTVTAAVGRALVQP